MTWLSIAERQAGAITSAQMRDAGVTRRQRERLVREGSIVPACRDVYLVTGRAAGWPQQVWVAVLASGPSAAAFRRSAAAWWRLDGVPAGVVEVAVPKGHQSRHPAARRSMSLRAADVTRQDGLPVTTVARTLLDLGTACSAGVVERALECALRRRMVSLAEMAGMARVRAPGASVLKAVLAARPPGVVPTESDAETLFLQIARRCGLPEPERQYPLLLRGRRCRLDFAWPAVRIGVEIDGFHVHGTPSALEADLRRQNRIVLDGWLILRFTWADVARRPSEAVVSDLRDGWMMRGGLLIRR